MPEPPGDREVESSFQVEHDVVGHASLLQVGRAFIASCLRDGVSTVDRSAATWKQLPGTYSQPFSLKAERSTPGGAYHPSAP